MVLIFNELVCMFTAKIGDVTQFDEHIPQVGWKHQLAMVS